MKRIFIICLSSWFLLSCGDFLEPKSTSEFVPKDANALNELLLGEAYPRYDKSYLSVFLSLLDDDVDGAPYQEPAETHDPNRWLAVFAWQSDMYKMIEDTGLADVDIYVSYYSLILGANAVLGEIDDVKLANDETDEMIPYVKAQALALRAFHYFQLVNIFGHPYNSNKEALGVPLKLVSEMEERELTRNTVGEVYEQIVADLLEAERLFKTLSETRQWSANYRVNLPMVQLLLSRVYLYMEEWEKAATYAKSVMDHPQFGLLNLTSIPTKDLQYNYYPYFMDYHNYSNSPEVIWVYGNVADYVGWTYTSATSSDGRQIRSYFKASDDLMNSFENTDLRKDRYIVRGSNYVSNANTGRMEYMPQAFGKVATQSDENFYKIFTYQVHARSFRLSEAYLNYCEAKAMAFKAGDAAAQAEALAALEELRSYRFAPENYQPVDIAAADDLVDFIREERRRELCFEDHRWFDLRRYGMPEIKHTWNANANTQVVYTLNEKDNAYTLPLPPQALELNKNLLQNPLNGSARVGETINL